ncbi:MAG TPA: hypothetical protein VLD61_09630 [Methylomirabilota bacterium]|nr:hypothetical protein [Methylomirabilota bacterium]
MSGYRLASIASALGILLVAGIGGAEPPRPEHFPNHTADRFVTLHWRLDREGERVRVSGIMDPGGRPFTSVILALYGLDAGGRIASQISTEVGPASFAPGSTPFTLTLRVTGREANYLLGVERFEQPGLRGSR